MVIQIYSGSRLVSAPKEQLCLKCFVAAELICVVTFFPRKAVELATKENKEFEHLCVYVAQDCAGIIYLIDRNMQFRNGSMFWCRN